ncbi:MAG TPA: hypothetical protein VHE53_03235 [Patescibacteria group bacterium]|nr:hypothetical protein [Patescibacteria group bacterium]
MIYSGVFVLELIILFYTSKYIYQALFLFFYRLFKNRNAASIPVFILFMPGVFIHELAHFLIAEITFVKVYDFEVSPKIEDGLLKMGSVQVAKSDPFRRALIGVAPVIVGVAVIICVLYFYLGNVNLSHIFNKAELIKTILAVWVLFFTTNTMFSSKKDLEGTVELSLGLSFLLIVFIVASFILKFDFWTPLLSFLNSSGVESAFSRISYLFLIPVAINIIVFLIAKALFKKII